MSTPKGTQTQTYLLALCCTSNDLEPLKFMTRDESPKDGAVKSKVQKMVLHGKSCSATFICHTL